MKYAATYRLWLHEQAAAKEGNYASIGAWTLLSVFAADRELGEGPTPGGDVPVADVVIPDCAGWSDRYWISSACIDRAGVKAAVDGGLARWDGDDLVVFGYDLKGQRAAEKNRANGAKGGRPKKGGKKKPSSEDAGSESERPPSKPPQEPRLNPSVIPPPKPTPNPQGNQLTEPGGETQAEPLTSPNLTSPCPTTPLHATAAGASPPDDFSGGPSEAEMFARLFAEVFESKELSAISEQWDHQQRSGALRGSRWCQEHCDGDWDKLRTELVRLKQDDWLSRQCMHVVARKLGTGNGAASGAAPAPTRDEYDPEARLV